MSVLPVFTTFVLQLFYEMASRQKTSEKCLLKYSHIKKRLWQQ